MRDGGDLVVVGDERGAGRCGDALLGAGDTAVDAPLIDADVDAAEGCDRVDDQQGVILLAELADLFHRLHHGGGGLAVDAGDCLVAALLEFGFDLVRLKDGAPLALDQRDLCAAALEDLGEQVAETAECRNQDLVARADCTGEDGLQTAAGGRVDNIGLLVLGLEYLTRHFHGLGHERGKLRVELTEDMVGHGAEDARVGVNRAGTHEQAR